MNGLKVMFYVQHLLGIGHLARASRIARAMLDAGLSVTLVTGGRPVPGFPGPGIPHIVLPPLAVRDGAFKGLVTESGDPADEAFLAHRTALLLAAFQSIRPDIVMIEAYPFGRRQMRFELVPLLDQVAEAEPRPLLVTSLRDILQLRGRADRDQETVDLIRSHFDMVLVHGDPAFAALEDSFPFADQIADKVAYTGLVVPPLPPAATERFDVVVSAGGGAVGHKLIDAALEAAALMPDLEKWLVLIGPTRSEADLDHLISRITSNVTLSRFRPDLASLMGGARLSVSQAGYNTVGDVLQSGCNALLIPFSGQGETEQVDRAMRLAARGRAAVLGDDDLSGRTLAAKIRQSLAHPTNGAEFSIAVNGAEETARMIMKGVRDGRRAGPGAR